MSSLARQGLTALAMGVLATVLGAVSVVLGVRDTLDENHGLAVAAGIRTPLLLVTVALLSYAGARRWGGGHASWALTAVGGYLLTLWSWGAQALLTRSLLADGAAPVGLGRGLLAWAVDLLLWTGVAVAAAHVGEQSGEHARATRVAYDWAR